MEIEELKTIWQKYDSKLDNLEKLNKKLIMETLSKKPQKRLNGMKYRSFSSLVIVPVVLVLLLRDSFRVENIDLKFIIGCLLTFICIAVVSYLKFKCFMALKGVDLSTDSIIESVRKVAEFKSFFEAKRKFSLMYYPMYCAGILLICWKSFNFNAYIVFFLIGAAVLSLVLGYRRLKFYQGKIERLEKDIHDLNEYAD